MQRPIVKKEILLATKNVRLQVARVFLLAWSIGTSLLVLGFLLHGTSVLSNTNLFFQWLFAISEYTLLWFILVVGIVALKKGTAMSVILRLGVWLLITLIMPTLLNLVRSTKERLPNRTEIIHTIQTAKDPIKMSRYLKLEVIFAVFQMTNKNKTVRLNMFSR